MTSTNATLERVDKKLAALKILFNVSNEDLAVRGKNFVFDNHVDLSTVFQDSNSAISLVRYAKKEVGHPLHAHNNLKEYLIVTNGSFLFKTPDFVRVLDKGDCASIPPGLQHTTISLVEGAELVAICVPPEEAYLDVGEK